MKILDNNLRPNRSEVKKAEGAKGQKTPQSLSVISSSGDHLELSGAHGQIQTLKADLEQVSDVRSDVVDSVRQELADGTYWDSRSPEDIVSAMLEHCKKYE